MDEANRHKKEIAQRRSQGGTVLRFYVKAGDETEIVILDNSLEEAVAFYEHNLQDAQGRWSIHEPCIKDFDDCPICANGSNSYYVMMLSVLVLKPFTVNRGKPTERVIPHSKMLLPVKVGQFDLFQKLEAAAKQAGGRLRGMYLVMSRGSDPKASRIGDPQILEDGKMFDLISEEDLVNEYGHEAVLGQDGKTVLRAENYDITPYNYEKLFPMPDVDSIRNRYGSSSPRSGSVDEAVDEFSSNEGTDDIPMSHEDDVVAEPEPETTVRRRRSPSKKTAKKKTARSKAKDENPFDV
jgi:hypothetical protein